mgnify:CR=1 FL=1
MKNEKMCKFFSSSGGEERDTLRSLTALALHDLEAWNDFPGLVKAEAIATVVAPCYYYSSSWS